MFTLIGMSDAKNLAGERERAVELLDEAVALCETVPQLASRSEAFNELAVRFHDYGQTGKARAFLHANLENIAMIRSQAGRSVSLAELAALYERFEFRLTDEEKLIMNEMVRKAEVQ